MGSPTPQDRFSELSEAILRINDSLGEDTVLQRIVEGARSLTGAAYGAIQTTDGSGRMGDFKTTGLAAEAVQANSSRTQASRLPGHIGESLEPLRLADLAAREACAGVPKNHPPMMSFLRMPIRHMGDTLGSIYLTGKKGGKGFTRSDEQTLVVFASLAALAIVDARRFQEERRFRHDLATLNLEARRIVRGHHAPGHTLAEILSVLTFRRPDGRREWATTPATTKRVPISSGNHRACQPNHCWHR